MKGRRFLELSAGGHCLSRALRRLAVPAWAIDVSTPLGNDILSDALGRWVRWHIAQRNVAVLWVAVPRRPPEHGRLLATAVARFCRLASRMNIPWAIEHPAASGFWEHLPIKQLADQQFSQACIYDFCVFGAPWRRPTQLLVSRLPELALAAVVCQPKQNICSTSGKHHLMLAGQDRCCPEVAARSGRYPPRLGRCWAQHLRASLIENKLGEHIC